MQSASTRVSCQPRRLSPRPGTVDEGFMRKANASHHFVLTRDSTGTRRAKSLLIVALLAESAVGAPLLDPHGAPTVTVSQKLAVGREAGANCPAKPTLISFTNRQTYHFPIPQRQG